MNRYATYLLTPLLLLMLSRAYPQTRIQIINADLMEFNDFGDRKIRTLTGNVKLEQNGVYLACERADFDADANTVDAFGNVHIQQDTVDIYADKLFYNGNDRKAKLSGNVRLTDRKMTLRTTQLDYDMNSRTGYYNTGGELKSDTSVLTSKIGYYYAATRDVYFKKEVQLTNPSYKLTADTLRFNIGEKRAYFLGPTYIRSDSNHIYCERGYYDTEKEITQFSKHATLLNEEQQLRADSITYDKLTGMGYATGNVYWTDTIRRNSIKSSKAIYNEKFSSVLATGDPIFVDAADKDTMFLKADTLYSATIDSGGRRWFHAYHHVVIYKSTVRARCDSVYYSDADSTFRFYENPILWVDANQLTADTISMTSSNKQLKHFTMVKNALIVNMVDTLRFNQIQGKKMTGFFKDGDLHRLYVEGNGESIYYGEDDGKKLIGVNKAVCSNMMISIKEDKVERITFLDKPTAVLYPPEDVPEEALKLKLFKWLLSDKPERGAFP